MTFDLVHDSQAVYRALVRAYSFPGTAVRIEGPAARSEGAGNLPSTLAAVALTLLDPETSWSGTGLDVVADLTGSPSRPASRAAFLLVAAWADEDWSAAFREAGRGTLADPHEGATVVAWSGAGTVLRGWQASGPGLEAPRTLNLPEGRWVEARNRACAEFPLGVDLVWCQDSTVTALPRTTRLRAAGEA